MKRARRHPERSGAATAAATTIGDLRSGGGAVAGQGVGDEFGTQAEGNNEEKVLNEELMEKVLGRENLQAAYRAVKANGGAAGIDHISTTELGEHLRKHWSGIKAKLEKGSYKPAPVRAVEIGKSGGGRRRLGIPTTVDRVIQQALHQELDKVFDPGFSEHSYGFRRKRGAHQAVEAARGYVVEQQRVWVVDIDIKAFFDNIDHDILMRMVARKVRDKRVLKLIGKYLRSGVLENGKVKRSAKGAPQGGPLSPLLGNIYLDALDKELESRGVSFCRYADDVTIYAKSKRSAERTKESIVKWIGKKLKLEVNSEKSGIRPPDEGSFLGFRIDDKGQIAMSEKSIAKFKERVREHWDNRRSETGREVLEKWQKFLRGWWGYYRLSERVWDWEDIEGWIRRHMRKWFWQRWHNWKGRHNALLKLRVSPRQMRIAHGDRGAWRVALILGTILTNRWLEEHGFWVPSNLAKEGATPT